MNMDEITKLKGLQRLFNTSPDQAFVFRHAGSDIYIFQPKKGGVYGLKTKQVHPRKPNGEEREDRTVPLQTLVKLSDKRGQSWCDVPAELAVVILRDYAREPKGPAEEAMGSYHGGAIKHARDTQGEHDRQIDLLNELDEEIAKKKAELEKLGKKEGAKS